MGCCATAAGNYWDNTLDLDDDAVLLKEVSVREGEAPAEPRMIIQRNLAMEINPNVTQKFLPDTAIDPVL